ncbi:MAG: ABC transporter substrate-binding protein [Candidatus Dormibacteraceae bacterium]
MDERLKIDRRRFMLGAATLATTAGLAACGTSLGGSSGSGGGNSGAKVTLTQYYHEYGEAGTEQAVKRYAQEYTSKHKNVTINVEWVPGTYATKLNTALAGPNPPDIYETTPTLQMVEAKQCAPLDDLYTSAEKADMFANVLAANTINGHIYGAKIVTDVGLLYYRKSMLKSAGVKPPTTTDELVTAARKLTSGKVKGLFAGDDGGVAALYELLIQANGVDLITNNKVAFATPAAAEALQALVQLNQQGSVLTGYQPDYLEPNAFNNGLCAMQWTGLWVMPELTVGDDYGVLPFPAVSSAGKPVTFLGGWSECVYGKGPHVDEAKKFVQWLWIKNKQAQLQFNTAYGYHLPGFKSVAKQAQSGKLNKPQAKAAIEILDKYGVYSPPSWDTDINTTYTNAVAAIVQNRQSTAQALATLQQAQSQAQSQLKSELGAS